MDADFEERARRRRATMVGGVAGSHEELDRLEPRDATRTCVTFERWSARGDR